MVQKNELTIKAPLVLGEQENVQVLIDSRELLEPSALKVTDIVADIRNLQLDVVVLDIPEKWVPRYYPLPKVRIKVIIQGILHKQIFWVGKKDNQIHHMQVNVPFSTFVLFTEKDILEMNIPYGFKFDPKKIQAQIWDEDVEAVISHLISPNRLQEKVILGFTVKLEQLAQIPVNQNYVPTN